MKISKIIRVLILSMLICLCLGVITAAAYVESPWIYSIAPDDTVIIERYTGEAEEVRVPWTLADKDVKYIKQGALTDPVIRKVEVPKNDVNIEIGAMNVEPVYWYLSSYSKPPEEPEELPPTDGGDIPDWGGEIVINPRDIPDDGSSSKESGTQGQDSGEQGEKQEEMIPDGEKQPSDAPKNTEASSEGGSENTKADKDKSGTESEKFEESTILIFDENGDEIDNNEELRYPEDPNSAKHENESGISAGKSDGKKVTDSVIYGEDGKLKTGFIILIIAAAACVAAAVILIMRRKATREKEQEKH